jgi:hypothetical protein
MMSITDHGMVQKTLRKLERHGVARTLHRACLRAVNRVISFRILRGLHAEAARSAFLACPPRYRGVFASAAALKRFAQDPETGLTPHFIEQALQAGDECYAVLEGDKLASYGWHSTRPTPLGPPQLVVHFAPGFVYRYKGFTITRYRGQRLHAIGMTRALCHYVAQGHRGIVCYVDSTNFASLKSCLRMGYRVFGSIYLVRLFGRYFCFATPGCKAFGFQVRSAS